MPAQSVPMAALAIARGFGVSSCPSAHGQLCCEALKGAKCIQHSAVLCKWVWDEGTETICSHVQKQQQQQNLGENLVLNANYVYFLVQ